MKGFFPPPLKCRVTKGERIGVRKLSGVCLEGVWKVCGRCKFFRPNFFETKISSGHTFFFKKIFFLCQIFWNLQFLQIISKSQICSGP